MNPLFREEAIKHKTERLLGEVIIAHPVSLSVLTLLVTLGTSLALLFLVTNDYTRRENVTGYLVPTKGVVAVYPTQPGLLAELYVSEGDLVEQGQELFKIQIDQRSASTSYVSEEIIQELHKQEQHLNDSVTLEQKNLAAQLEKQDSHISQLGAEIHALNDLLSTQARLADLDLNAYDRAKELSGRGVLAKSDLDGSLHRSYLSRVSRYERRRSPENLAFTSIQAFQLQRSASVARRTPRRGLKTRRPARLWRYPLSGRIARIDEVHG
jgi:membrane fusion protein